MLPAFPLMVSAALDEQLLTIGEWEGVYSEIFGNKSNEVLTESQVLERVMFMQEEVETISDRDKAITVDMNDAVAYCFDGHRNRAL